MTDSKSIARYLRAIGEPTDTPGRSPSRGPPYWKSTVLRIDDAAWRRAIARALVDPGGWVVQAFHSNTVRRIDSRSYYVTYGVINAPAGCCVLSRASAQPVVNVSRGGGLVAVFGKR